MIAEFLVWYLVFLFSTTCHEFAHAYLAYRGGDRTAYEGGQVSLDPTPHIKRSPVGMVLAPLISLYFFGMMLGWGAAPYDPRWANRYPKRYAMMSLAGPMTNFLLASISLVAMLVLVKAGVFVLTEVPTLTSLVTLPGQADLSSPLGALSMLLSVGLCLNVILGVFNLFPVPPLDGAAAVEGLFSRSLGMYMARMRESPIFAMLGLLVAWNIAPMVISPVLDFWVGVLRAL